MRLFVTKNKELRDFPSPLELPSIRVIHVHYPYHCCQFKKEKEKPLTTGINDDVISVDETGAFKWEIGLDMSNTLGSDNYTMQIGLEDEQDDSISGMDPVLVSGIGTQDLIPENDTVESDISSGDGLQVYPSYNGADKPLECTPEPDPFFPCDELMEFVPLRVGVWLVFLLALLGNAAVIAVIFVSKTKMDVSRFLICNLAFADLCMGVYLGLLAIVDLSTRGNFKKFAVEWQLSPGCKSAGFLAILSSESSVLTLATITIERYIAIKHALHVNKRMSLKSAIIIMACVWSFSMATATLPLANISSYTKFSICLPFETGDSGSLAFVTFLLVLNGTAFLVILTCYVLIYCSIKGSNAWNTNDFRVAKRMAVLVVTDFVCWAPITFLALTAAFGSTLIDLSTAKFLAVFIFPLNSCANPFLYAFFTKQFKSECILICKKVKDNQSLKTSRPLNQRRKFSLSAGFDSRRISGASSNNTSFRLDHSLEGLLNRLREQRRNSMPAAIRLCTATSDATVTTSLQPSALDSDKGKSTLSVPGASSKEPASTDDLELRKNLITSKEAPKKQVMIQKVTCV